VLRSAAFQEELFHCIQTLPAPRLQTRLGLSEYFIKSVLARWVPFFAHTTLSRIVSLPSNSSSSICCPNASISLSASSNA
jgi:hypothetical protein